MYPKPCRNCDRLMRPGKTKATDYPGTVTYKARGLCGTCYANLDRTLKPSFPKPCGNCDVLMRPASAPPEDYPTAETIHRAHGLCEECYMHQRNTKPPTGLALLRHENNIAGLNRFMARIRGKSRL